MRCGWSGLTVSSRAHAGHHAVAAAAHPPHSSGRTRSSMPASVEPASDSLLGVVRESPRISVPGCESRVIDSPGFTLAETERCLHSASRITGPHAVSHRSKRRLGPPSGVCDHVAAAEQSGGRQSHTSESAIIRFCGAEEQLTSARLSRMTRSQSQHSITILCRRAATGGGNTSGSHTHQCVVRWSTELMGWPHKPHLVHRRYQWKLSIARRRPARK
jgi:hypothetical protein